MKETFSPNSSVRFFSTDLISFLSSKWIITFPSLDDWDLIIAELFLDIFIICPTFSSILATDAYVSTVSCTGIITFFVLGRGIGLTLILFKSVLFSFVKLLILLESLSAFHCWNDLIKFLWYFRSNVDCYNVN